jgi:alanine racemase
MTAHDPGLHPAIAPLAGPAEAEAGGILTIDLGAVAANWKKLSSTTVPVECAAVVKADAYGCGLEPVARKLVEVGCRTFFVADLAEGRRLRAVAPNCDIYLLNGIMPGTAPAVAEARLRPVINSTTELAEWDSFVATKGWRGGAALHVDTGMRRLGVSPEEAIAIAARLQSENHGLKLLMSHLACADTPDHALNDKQVRLFRDIRINYRGLASSLANSSGIFMGSTVHCDLVRPGIALYGSNPTPGRRNPMRPVFELKGRIIQVRAVDRGDTIGYGASFSVARPSRIATIALGYGDGYLRSAGASKAKAAAHVVIGGRQCPVVGRVTMDLITADVTELPEGTVRRGDFATVIGDGIDVDELGAAMGTVGYEVLTHLGRRYHRIYKDA